MSTLLIILGLAHLATCGIVQLSPAEEAEKLSEFSRLCLSENVGESGVTIDGVQIFCKQSRATAQEFRSEFSTTTDIAAGPSQAVYVQPPPLKLLHRVTVNAQVQNGDTKVLVVSPQVDNQYEVDVAAQRAPLKKPTVNYLAGGDAPQEPSGGYDLGNRQSEQQEKKQSDDALEITNPDDATAASEGEAKMLTSIATELKRQERSRVLAVIKPRQQYQSPLTPVSKPRDQYQSPLTPVSKAREQYQSPLTPVSKPRQQSQPVSPLVPSVPKLQQQSRPASPVVPAVPAPKPRAQYQITQMPLVSPSGLRPEVTYDQSPVYYAVTSQGPRTYISNNGLQSQNVQVYP